MPGVDHDAAAADDAGGVRLEFRNTRVFDPKPVHRDRKQGKER